MLTRRVPEPNGPSARGAGPTRKTFVQPKAWTAPNPLQPTLRQWTGTNRLWFDVGGPGAATTTTFNDSAEGKATMIPWRTTLRTRAWIDWMRRASTAPARFAPEGAAFSHRVAVVRTASHHRSLGCGTSVIMVYFPDLKSSTGAKKASSDSGLASGPPAPRGIQRTYAASSTVQSLSLCGV